MRHMDDTTTQPASPELVELREAAREAAGRARVPYSRFPVGAALRFRDGAVVTGCNVENASYGLTVCAERTALVRAVAEGRDVSDVDLVAVHVDGPSGEPCGMCRQFLLELVPDARIAFVHAGELVEMPVRGLLPAGFVPAALGFE
jgi:cytidine deaminase